MRPSARSGGEKQHETAKEHHAKSHTRTHYCTRALYARMHVFAWETHDCLELLEED